MTITTAILIFVILLAVVLCWFGLHYMANPLIDEPDGVAKVTGNCGDTMEIALQFVDDKVCNTHHWTNGCSFSKRCVESAAIQAKDKSVEELQKINMITIIDDIGSLPETHLHCAQLAETTLQRAVKNYLAKQGTVRCHKC